MGPRRVEARRVVAQNLAFFSLSRSHFVLFLSLSGCLHVEFGGVFEGRDPLMYTFGVLGLSCETPAATKPLCGC